MKKVSFEHFVQVSVDPTVYIWKIFERAQVILME